QDEDQDSQNPQSHLPSKMLDERVRDQRDQRAAEADAQVSETHRLAARLVEPARKQNLHGQRAAAYVSESVEQIEEVEQAESRDAAEADQRDAGHQNSRHHDVSRAKAVDDPAGDESEQRSDQQFAQSIAGGDLGAAPSELLHHEVVIKR